MKLSPLDEREGAHQNYFSSREGGLPILTYLYTCSISNPIPMSYSHVIIIMHALFLLLFTYIQSCPIPMSHNYNAHALFLFLFPYNHVLFPCHNYNVHALFLFLFLYNHVPFRYKIMPYSKDDRISPTMTSSSKSNFT